MFVGFPIISFLTIILVGILFMMVIVFVSSNPSANIEVGIRGQGKMPIPRYLLLNPVLSIFR
jgi:phosphotransferase system  glucose/maltose/N-acetylglucosamine-specific IIC component